ncbi:hypothetical protein QTN25_005571 [Entamoeba marina]
MENQLVKPIQLTLPFEPISHSIDGYGNNLYVVDSQNSLISFSFRTNSVISRHSLPPNTTKVFASPTSKYIGIYSNNSIEIFSLPNFQSIGVINDVLDFVWSNDSFLTYQQLLVLKKTLVESYRIVSVQDGQMVDETSTIEEQERLEKCNELGVTGKRILINNQYSIACVYDDDKIISFPPSLECLKENLNSIPMKKGTIALSFCKAELFVLCGATLIRVKDSKEMHLPFRGSEFHLLSHFSLLLVYDESIIYVVNPDKLSILVIIDTNMKGIVDLQTNTKLSLLIFRSYNSNQIHYVTNKEYTTDGSMLLMHTNDRMKIYSKETCEIQQKVTSDQGMATKTFSVAPSTDYSIFIGKTSGLLERDIKEVFENKFGRIIKVRLSHNFGFIDFEEEKSKDNALRHQNFEVKGKSVTISTAVKSKR